MGIVISALRMVAITEEKIHGRYLYRVWVDGAVYRKFWVKPENRLNKDEIEWSRASFERSLK